MDFDTYFGITMNPAELVIRGTLVYWFLFLIFRFVMRRGTGALGIADLLLLVLLADASQNAMSGGYDCRRGGDPRQHDPRLELADRLGQLPFADDRPVRHARGRAGEARAPRAPQPAARAPVR